SSSLSSRGPAAHRDLPSFPTRRSSDLRLANTCAGGVYPVRLARAEPEEERRIAGTRREKVGEVRGVIDRRDPLGHPRNLQALVRSEEHMSELQSRENLVCRLLLEKKNK